MAASIYGDAWKFKPRAVASYQKNKMTASIYGDAWKFKPNAEVRYEDDNSVLAFVCEFIRYLNSDVSKRKVKEHFDARCREFEFGKEQSQLSSYTFISQLIIISQLIYPVNTFTRDFSGLKSMYTQFFPRTIIKQCIIECTDRDALYPLRSVDKIYKLEQRIANLLSRQEHRHLYRDLCSRLGIKVAVGFSLVSPEPYVPPPVSGARNAGAAAPRFVPRGGGE